MLTHRQYGFSFLELLLAIGVSLTVASISLKNVSTSVASTGVTQDRSEVRRPGYSPLVARDSASNVITDSHSTKSSSVPCRNGTERTEGGHCLGWSRGGDM